MKKVLRYVIAVIILGTIGIGTMPLVTMGALKISVLNIMKLGLSKTQGSGIMGEAVQLIGPYIRDYAYILLGLLVLILFVAVLTAVLPVKAAYAVSAAGQLIINIYAGILYVQMRNKFSSLKSMLNAVIGFLPGDETYGLGTLEIRNLPVAVWVIMYLLAFVLAVCGLILKEGKVMQGRPGDILPENFQTRGNAYLERIQELEANRQRNAAGMAASVNNSGAAGSYGRQPVDPGMPGSYGQRSGPGMYGNAGMSGENPVSMPAKSVQMEFQGAITGESGMYASKTYAMRDRIPVYFFRAEQGVAAGADCAGELLASVYFIMEYQEYCVEPARRMSVFLESGQPLGAGREYYLPRGMKIRVAEREDVFVLE